MIKTVQKGTYSKPMQTLFWRTWFFLEDFDRLERPHIEPKKFKKLCVLGKPGVRDAKDLDLFSTDVTWNIWGFPKMVVPNKHGFSY